MTPDAISSAPLNDLHKLIDWLSRYDAFIRNMPELPMIHDDITEQNVNPKEFLLIQHLSELCRSYVNGTDVSLFYSRFEAIWSAFIINPTSSIKTNSAGQFFTPSVDLLWSQISQIGSLALSTICNDLHIEISKIISHCMFELLKLVSAFINNFDSANLINAKSKEFEFYCALLNDIASHFDRVSLYIDQFEKEETKQRLDDIFDPVCESLVQCGQNCLKYLAVVCVRDVQEYVSKV